MMNVALGYGARAELRHGPRFRRPDATLAYGPHPLQAFDLHLAKAPGLQGSAPRPLLAFIHGGAWQFGDKTRRIKDQKAPFAHAEGWHFASLNFRLVPEANPAEMARDVAAGLALLVKRAEEFGIDPARIAVMGHSSGAHLAALVASNPALLGAHGLAPHMLAGVIANDGAAYDPTRPSTTSRLLTRRLLEPAFAGVDPLAVSPVHHLARAASALPPFLILAARPRGASSQSRLLAQALRDAGGTAELAEFAAPGVLGHMRLSRHFGRIGHAPTETARQWLRRVLNR